MSKKQIIKQSALEILRKFVHLDEDKRYSLGCEVRIWWFNKVDIDDQLFIPNREEVRNAS